jgi:hypothetical protein
MGGEDGSAISVARVFFLGATEAETEVLDAGLGLASILGLEAVEAEARG